MIPPTLAAIGAAIAFTAGAAASYQLTSDHYKAAALDQAEKMHVVSAELERERREKKVIYRTIEKRVPTYIDRAVYLRDCADDDGLRDADAALTRRAHPGKPGAAMPGPDANGGEDGR